MRRKPCRYLLPVALGVSVLAGPHATPAQAARTVVAPVADTYVSAKAPGANFGRSRRLDVGARPVERAYLRFDITLPPGAKISGATLRLKATSSRRVRLGVYAVTARGWSESRLTMHGAPRLGRRLGVLRPAHRQYEAASLDAQQVQPGQLAVALAGRGALGARFAARETRGGPRLVVTYSVVPSHAPPGPPSSESPPPAPPSPTASAEEKVILAAGDIQQPATTLNATAPLLDAIAYDALLPLGDNEYERGLLAEYNAFYSQTWGTPARKARSYPIPGNHESPLRLAVDYCPYFTSGVNGPAAVNPCPDGHAYYSYDLGSWHMVALDSSSGTIDPAQQAWLRADLAAHPATCTLAYMHHPRYTSGIRGENLNGNVWDDLIAAHVDVVLSAHTHAYQRYAPMNNTGGIDPVNGIRSFVVGTGGMSLNPIPAAPGLEAHSSAAFGVLQMTLRRGGYDWRFIPAAGATFTDSGADLCH
jgi:hypothetical protein